MMCLLLWLCTVLDQPLCCNMQTVASAGARGGLHTATGRADHFHQPPKHPRNTECANCDSCGEVAKKHPGRIADGQAGRQAGRQAQDCMESSVHGSAAEVRCHKPCTPGPFITLMPVRAARCALALLMDTLLLQVPPSWPTIEVTARPVPHVTIIQKTSLLTLIYRMSNKRHGCSVSILETAVQGSSLDGMLLYSDSELGGRSAHRMHPSIPRLAGHTVPDVVFFPRLHPNRLETVNPSQSAYAAGAEGGCDSVWPQLRTEHGASDAPPSHTAPGLGRVLGLPRMYCDNSPGGGFTLWLSY
jgi:hypothetical protein